MCFFFDFSRLAQCSPAILCPLYSTTRMKSRFDVNSLCSYHFPTVRVCRSCFFRKHPLQRREPYQEAIFISSPHTDRQTYRQIDRHKGGDCAQATRKKFLLHPLCRGEEKKEARNFLPLLRRRQPTVLHVLLPGCNVRCMASASKKSRMRETDRERERSFLCRVKTPKETFRATGPHLLYFSLLPIYL